MGRLKRSLVTEPKYARDAAALFREMKKYEEVELIDTDALVKANAAADENSLYEAVFTDTPYVDACLRRYLGRIQKCDSVEALEQVSDGVTPDCYSYSNYSFRHLRRNDYEKYACIGTKVSKAKLASYQETLAKQEAAHRELQHTIEQLKASAGFEKLDNDTEYFVRLSKAGKELGKVTGNIASLRQEITRLREGEYRALEEEKERLMARRDEKRTQQRQNQRLTNEYTRIKSQKEGEAGRIRAELDEKRASFHADTQMEAEAAEQLQSRSAQTVRSHL